MKCQNRSHVNCEMECPVDYVECTMVTDGMLDGMSGRISDRILDDMPGRGSPKVK